MKFRNFAILALLTLATSLGFGQAAAPAPAPEVQIAPSATFSLSAQAIALPGNKQTVAGTVIGGTFAITKNFSLREDNVLSPAANLQAYLGGVQYALPILSTKLNNVSSTLNGNLLQFYVTASVGVDHISSSGNDVQHYAFLGGGGINYDPTGSGKFSANLIEVRYAKLPGYANSTAIVSSGVKLGW